MPRHGFFISHFDARYRRRYFKIRTARDNANKNRYLNERRRISIIKDEISIEKDTKQGLRGTILEGKKHEKSRAYLGANVYVYDVVNA